MTSAVPRAIAVAGNTRPERFAGEPQHKEQVQIQRIKTTSLRPAEFAEVLDVCRAAYGEEMSPYLNAIGAGTHFLCRVDGKVVSHVMYVDRIIEYAGRLQLRAAYVELVATHPAAQRQGYAAALMRDFASFVTHYDIAALSPAVDEFYARLGWERWRGPLFVRTASHLVPTPDEEVMILRLPRTPANLDAGESLVVDWRPGEVW